MNGVMNGLVFQKDTFVPMKKISVLKLFDNTNELFGEIESIQNSNKLKIILM